MVSLVVGGERSSGKTSLLNILISGSVLCPFPRGVRGRLSLVNSATFGRSAGCSSSGLVAAETLRVSTSGINRRELEIRSMTDDCFHILMSTACDMKTHLLSTQPEDEPTCLALSVDDKHGQLFDSVTEVGPDSLRSFVEMGELIEPKTLRKVGDPDFYVHMTSAIKPLAHLERQAILKFIEKEVPMLLFVNKCDLVDDDESLYEVDSLVSVFSSIECGQWLPNYLCSFVDGGHCASGVIGASKAAEIVRDALLVGVNARESLGSRQGKRYSVGGGSRGLQSDASFMNPVAHDDFEEISVWPPSEHSNLIDSLNQMGDDPQALLEELRSLDAKVLSRLYPFLGSRISSRVRRFLNPTDCTES